MGGIIEGHLDASGLRVAIIVSRFNESITERLCRGAQDCLARHGCAGGDQTIVRVPGAWELPQAAGKLVASGNGPDAIIALGALIRGETPHFDVITSAVSRGLTQVGLDSGIPVIFGVLTTDTVEQANDRAGAKLGNKGWEAALSAVEMVHLYRRMA